VHDRFILADIGGFEVIHNHGLIGLFLLIYFYYRNYSCFNSTISGRAISMFFLFQFCLLPFINIIYSLEGIVLNFLLISSSKNEKN